MVKYRMIYGLAWISFFVHVDIYIFIYIYMYVYTIHLWSRNNDDIC